jgi:aminobenzoyl-glutamate utilization protein B
MNHMVNLMREHVPQEARIHYVITRGGEAPNVVPDFAEVYYFRVNARLPKKFTRRSRLTRFPSVRSPRSLNSASIVVAAPRMSAM